MTPEAIILATMVLGLTLYAVLGGADFGAGVWEFSTALLATKKERNLIYRAIGPVWEANHVWLIFIIVGMFGAFPAAFAAISRALWIPLLLVLVGIVFRGVGYAFRSYASGHLAHEQIWGALFALGSTSTPIFLGISLGAVVQGKLPIHPDGRFTGDYLTSWLTPMALFTGFYTTAMCAYLAAVYLTREAHQLGDEGLCAMWRQRAVGTGLWMGILSLAGLGFVAVTCPQLWPGFQSRSWPLVIASVLTGFASLAALLTRRFNLAAAGSALTVTTVIWGWALAQYPLLIPPSISIENAKAPNNVLWIMVGSIAVGAVLLIPALGYLFYLFKGHRPEPQSLPELGTEPIASPDHGIATWVRRGREE